MQQGFSYDDIIKPKIMYHMYIMDSWMHKETKPTAIKKQTRERETKIDDYSRARKK